MSASAADIISYVGIPLAVLGVLPMLYTCLKCLFTLRLIRRTLHRAGITNATTRSSLLSGIIEIEIPRQRLTPLAREDARYFDLAPHPSPLLGGSWTRFPWREMTIGLKSYRVQFHDEVRQPQAEVEFEPLVAYLLDRGAVPHPAGFALLRSSGLWTPAGTKLLCGPRSAEAALSVTAADDADGILSLVLEWEPEWQRHQKGSLPPYWIRIEGPPVRSEVGVGEGDSDEQDLMGRNDEKRGNGISKTATSVSYETKPALHLHVSASGLEDALFESEKDASFKSMDESPSITHLVALSPHLASSSPASTWFASALTAFHTLSPSPTLWAYPLPASVTSLSLHPAIPVGVLDLLGLRPSPAWRTISLSDETANALRQHEDQQKLLQRAAVWRTEAQIADPVARQRAVGDRMLREAQEMSAQRSKDELERRRREEEEQGEAVRSARLEGKVVAEACVRWLVRENDVCVERDWLREKEEGLEKEVLRKVVERVLYLMVEDAAVAEGVVRILELWRQWAEAAGMTREHLGMLKEELRNFAYAASMICLIREATTTPAGSAVSDLQECLRAWKKVRLG